MKKTVWCFVVVMFVALLPGMQAQDTKAFKRIVKELSSKEYQGRAYAQNGVVKAGNYLEQEFRKAGADSVFQQPFKININTFNGSMKMCACRRWDKALLPLKAGEDFVVREYSPGVKGRYKLYFVDTAHYNIDSIVADLNKPENKGCMVVCDFWFPYRHRDFRKLETAEAGNAGLIFTWDTPLKFYKAYGQKVVEKPVIWTTAEAMKEKYKVSFDIDNEMLTDYESSNIVACVKGRRHDSCFVFTAHYDHLGNLGNEIYCPGVNDNASGTAAIVTLAQYYAQHQPDFDIWFVAFAGEETGLNGSSYFVEHPAMELGRIKYLFNLDMIGDNNPVQYCEVSDAGMKGFAQLERINAEKHCFQSLNRGDLAANSDHYPFAQKGVPCILFEQQDGDYFQYYHTPQDDMKHFCAETYPKVFRLVTEYVKACSTPVPVDFRESVELMAMVWRLMGASEYNFTGYKPYCQSADEYFDKYKNHPVVAKAREVAEEDEVAYDAVAAYGLHLIISPEGRITFDKNLVKGSDRSFERWSEKMKKEFLPLLEDFYKQSGFHQWYLSTEPLRANALGAFAQVAHQLDIHWYDRFFGPQPKGSEFGIVLSILCGQCNYGCSATMKNGGMRVSPVISNCITDKEGNPFFRADIVLPILVHEFCHPYCNPLNAQNWKQMEKNATATFELRKEQLTMQAYPTPEIMLNETFVRSCTIRYLLAHNASLNKDVLVAEEAKLGFLMVPDMVMALDRYERHRNLYPTMQDYMPEYVKAVNDYDAEAVRLEMEEAEKRMAHYTCNIQDGATDVPSGEMAITITFDKPMKASVSMGYGRRDGAFPPLARGNKSVEWNDDHTVQTIWVRFEPHTAYAFSINGPNYKTLTGNAAKGIMLISFTTGD